MPELVSTRYEVEMDRDEARIYEMMKEELVLSIPGREVTAANAAVLTGKLLQLAGGAVYADSGEVVHIHDRKLDALEDIIEGILNGFISRFPKQRKIPTAMTRRPKRNAIP